MKHLIALITVALAVLLQGPLAGAEPVRHPAVVELFTSQGCNSCPPADAFLGQLVGRSDVIALSYNVDYWDYLGWRDTLASPANTERQQSYASAMHSQRVYTPQVVINGVTDAVGSDGPAIAAAIEKFKATGAKGPAIEMMYEEERVLVKISAGEGAAEATIWLLRFDHLQEVQVRRGENSGKSLKYHNVVRDFSNIGLWRGEAMEIAFMRGDLTKGGRDGCVILVQTEGHGPIIAAAQMDFQ